MNFADRLTERIKKTDSVLCAGFDPQPEHFPAFIKTAAAKSTTTDAEFVYRALITFYSAAIEALAGNVPIIKPNIAFFEQYGVPGIKAFSDICLEAKNAGLLVVADAKRGDIGSTAQAYATAFLGKPSFLGKTIPAFEVDAVTVNPFLGFDTLEPFIKECEQNGKGIFVLVKTSNPGSKDLQDLVVNDGSISSFIAQQLATQAQRLMGVCGLSGLGAVVGATHPDEARALREKMPSNYFLIPGYGAQGGSAAEAVAGFTNQGTGGIVNVSRALFGKFEAKVTDKQTLCQELALRAKSLSEPLAAAIS